MKKKILLILMGMSIATVIIEVSSYAFYFHKNCNRNLGLKKVIEHAKNYLLKNENSLRYYVNPDGIWEALYNKKEPYLEHLKNKYLTYFNEFLLEARSVNSKMIVLYAPCTKPGTLKHNAENICRNFFQNICNANNIKFVDITGQVREYDYELITLYPEDNHYSRLGNYIMARNALNAVLPFKKRNVQEVTILKSSLNNIGALSFWSGTFFNFGGHKIQVNKSGLRGLRDIDNPKSKNRIMCFGDSFTFGHGVQDEHTYPHIMQNLDRELEVLNFGQCGTTIVSQLDLLKQSKHINPDVIILQVLDNDIYGLMTHKQEIFGRVKPTRRDEEELVFLQKLNKL